MSVDKNIKEQVIKWLVKTYPEIKVAEMLDEEILNWVDDNWNEDFETEYDWYQDNGNKEAEEVIIQKIGKHVMREFCIIENTYQAVTKETLHFTISEHYYQLS